MHTRLTAALCAALFARPVATPLPLIHANDNRRSAGTLRHGALAVRLEARSGVWHPEAEEGVGVEVQAFGEEGKPLQNPGPLIRVPEGTEIRLSVRNAIPGATLVVHGLVTRPAAPADSVVLAPGAKRELRFRAGAPGTYFYWATTTGATLVERRTVDSQLNGAFIVDPAGVKPVDHVFVLGIWLDSLTAGGVREKRELPTINGKMFPYTESFTYSVGDSVRWRVINASDRGHPMHLHGFYYRVDSRGTAAWDSLYTPSQRRLAVTERLQSGATMTAAWSPDRPGKWIFHCHVLFHVAPDLALSRRRTTRPPVGWSSCRGWSSRCTCGLLLARPIPRRWASRSDSGCWCSRVPTSTGRTRASASCCSRATRRRRRIRSPSLARRSLSRVATRCTSRW